MKRLTKLLATAALATLPSLKTDAQITSYSDLTNTTPESAIIYLLDGGLQVDGATPQTKVSLGIQKQGEFCGFLDNIFPENPSAASGLLYYSDGSTGLEQGNSLDNIFAAVDLNNNGIYESNEQGFNTDYGGISPFFENDMHILHPVNISTPEPTTISLLTLSCLGLLKKRR